MISRPLAGKRYVHVSVQRTCLDFACVIRHLVDVLHPDAEKIVLVLDHLNSHARKSVPCFFVSGSQTTFRRAGSSLHAQAQLVAVRGRDQVGGAGAAVLVQAHERQKEPAKEDDSLTTVAQCRRRHG